MVWSAGQRISAWGPPAAWDSCPSRRAPRAGRVPPAPPCAPYTTECPVSSTGRPLGMRCVVTAHAMSGSVISS